MGPRAGLDGQKNLAPPGFDPRTVHPVAQSLYRLSYPAHLMSSILTKVYRIKRDVFLLQLAAYRAEPYLAYVKSAKRLFRLSLQMFWKSICC